MEAEGEYSPPRQHTRKRSVPEPRRTPWAKRRAGNAAVATENAAVAVSMHPPPRQLTLDGGPLMPDATASSSASDVPSSAAAKYNSPLCDISWKAAMEAEGEYSPPRRHTLALWLAL